MNKQQITELINSKIIDNDNGQITADVMRNVLNAINEGTGDGYTYIGTATPSTTPATLTGDEKVFYIATEEGDYSNFGLGEITEVSVVKSENGSWKVEGLGIYHGVTASKKLNPTWMNGYITTNGTLVQTTGLQYSLPVLVKAGETLEVFTRATANVSIISLTDKDASFYKPLVKGLSGSEKNLFTWEAIADMYVCISDIPDSNNEYSISSLTTRGLVEAIIEETKKEDAIPLKKSKNLLDISKSESGLLRPEGNVQQSETYMTSEIVRLEPNTTYVISSDYKLTGYALYSQSAMLDFYKPDSTEVVFSTNAIQNGVRITFNKNNVKTVQIEKGSVASEYEPYNKPTEIGNDKEGRPIIVRGVDQFEVDRTTNYIIKEMFTKNGYWKWDNTFKDVTTSVTCEPIAITSGTYIHNVSFLSVRCLNEDKEQISIIYNPTKDTPFIIPAGTAFAEISVTATAFEYWQNPMLVKGEQIPSEYIEGHIPLINRENSTNSIVQCRISHLEAKKFIKNSFLLKKYAALGDSTTYRGHWQEIVNYYLDSNSVNLACSGTTIGGFAFHYTTGGSESSIDNATPDRLLNENDIADCDAIVICGYGNSWAGHHSLGSMEDSYINIKEEDASDIVAYNRLIRSQPFIPAARSVVEYMQKLKPSARIIIADGLPKASSRIQGYDPDNIDLHGKNDHGLTPQDYSDALKEVAKFYSLPFADIMSRCGVNNLNWSNFYSSTDQVHPNFNRYRGGIDYPDSGMKRMAIAIAEELSRS